MSYSAFGGRGRRWLRRSRSRRCLCTPSTLGATMLADLDLLLTAVFCTADDLLPVKAKNARRSVTDAEVVTLAVAAVDMGVSSDDRFLRLAARSLKELFPKLPKQPGYHKPRAKLAETIEWLIGVF